EGEEDVVQGGPTHRKVGQGEAGGVQLSHDLGQDGHTVGDEDGHLAGLGVHLRGAAAEVGQHLGGAGGGVGGGQAELEAVAADLCLELLGGAVGEDAAVVDDH